MAMELARDNYNDHVEVFRAEEYPMLKDAVYLDHAGSTLPSKSFMEQFSKDIITNLYGNPHSGSPSSQLSTNRIEDIRLKTLRFFNADPDIFDLVFVANATAGIKLVMDGLRDVDGGFSYAYHKDAHTSLIGIRESARSTRCVDDEDVEQWLSGSEMPRDENCEATVRLFAYPAQSNMNGRRLPLSWAWRARDVEHSSRPKTYTLLDAAAFASTSQLDLSDTSTAPDFTVLSFYKIFGFPDLGALIVRKDSGTVLKQRKYFAGGTVDLVLCVKEQWHALKSQSLHETLEDGTLPFHNIMALHTAIDCHKELYGSMEHVARHTAFLAQKLFDGLSCLRHANHKPLCLIHSLRISDEKSQQGPIVAFNLQNAQGAWVSNTEFERLASVRKFHIRSGGLCNPGGVATCLKLEPWEMRQNFSAGLKCGAETDIYAGKATGVIRASVGAMSTINDVEAFVSFIREFYTEADLPLPSSRFVLKTCQQPAQLTVESLTIYPIKSCGGYSILPKLEWEVRPEGLAWDREWCLIHQGTGQALSQKRHPRMALIRPTIDFQHGVLRVRYSGSRIPSIPEEIQIPLSSNPALFAEREGAWPLASQVCGDAIVTRKYVSEETTAFFSAILGVSCVLARFPAGGSGYFTRHSKAHLQKHQRPKKTPNEISMPGTYPLLPTPPDSDNEHQARPILLSNESPILAINKASLDVLNQEIKLRGGKIADASVFRANVVLAPISSEGQPYDEDHWSTLCIGEQRFQMLGSCRRCHMICIDQDTAQKDQEPFVTLAKTRRFDSKIFFGSHMCHVSSKGVTRDSQYPTISVGDSVSIERRDDD